MLLLHTHLTANFLYNLVVKKIPWQNRANLPEWFNWQVYLKKLTGAKRLFSSFIAKSVANKRSTEFFATSCKMKNAA